MAQVCLVRAGLVTVLANWNKLSKIRLRRYTEKPQRCGVVRGTQLEESAWAVNRVCDDRLDRRLNRKSYLEETAMETKGITRALLPTRLIAEAARESSRSALGRIEIPVTDTPVTVTDRRLKPGVACCRLKSSWPKA